MLVCQRQGRPTEGAEMNGFADFALLMVSAVLQLKARDVPDSELLEAAEEVLDRRYSRFYELSTLDAAGRTAAAMMALMLAEGEGR